MTVQERRVLGDREPFDYYLSAFLSAAMSVRDGFKYRQNRPRDKAIKAWHAQWESNLTAEEKPLYEFMRKDRNAEVHNLLSGSSRTVAREAIEGNPIGTPSTGGGVILIDIDGPLVMAPAVMYKPTFHFIIDGAERKATKACAAYLALLQRMVAQFEAAHP